MMGVSIVGCGWLGQALAKSLMTENIAVLASYQSESTLAKLEQLAIPATKLILPIEGVNENIESIILNKSVDKALFNNDVLVIAIPPQLKKGKIDYPKKIQQLVTLAEAGTIKKIILLNSTAIYNGLAGDLNEEANLDFNAEKVEVLQAAEQVAKTFSKQVIILRLAGLVGPNRHPGKFLQSDRLFKNASAQVNLVHQTDVVNIIMRLINVSSESTDDIYNVVSATNSDRKQYYQAAAKAKGLSEPKFEQEECRHEGKKIVGDKLRQALNYQYQYDDLLQWASAIEFIDELAD